MESNSHGARLTNLRKAAGLSVRELARQVSISHSTIIFWEKGDTVPRSDVLVPMARALGVSLEVLLGAKTPKAKASGGRVRQAFEAVSNLPRRQQAKIVDVVEAMIDRVEAKAS